MVLDELKGVAILVNKWDLVIKDDETFNRFTEHVRREFSFIPYAPLLFISAKTGQRVNQVLPLALEIAQERQKRVPTAELNTLLREATYNHPPTAVHKGAHLRLYYATQPQVAPPVFLFFANNADQVHWGYGRYLENQIRDKYDFTGTPIKIVFRSREERREDQKGGKPARPKAERKKAETPGRPRLDDFAGDDDEAEVIWVDE
jgi:GTP-binding protein